MNVCIVVCVSECDGAYGVSFREGVCEFGGGGYHSTHNTIDYTKREKTVTALNISGTESEDKKI